MGRNRSRKLAEDKIYSVNSIKNIGGILRGIRNNLYSFNTIFQGFSYDNIIKRHYISNSGIKIRCIEAQTLVISTAGRSQFASRYLPCFRVRSLRHGCGQLHGL